MQIVDGIAMSCPLGTSDDMTLAIAIRDAMGPKSWMVSDEEMLKDQMASENARPLKRLSRLPSCDFAIKVPRSIEESKREEQLNLIFSYKFFDKMYTRKWGHIERCHWRPYDETTFGNKLVAFNALFKMLQQSYAKPKLPNYFLNGGYSGQCLESRLLQAARRSSKMRGKSSHKTVTWTANTYVLEI
eukprot:6203164-Amphidinium_carterae.1